MRYTFLFSFLILLACANDDSSKKEVITVANTPEAVAQFWLEAYFDNKFEAAKTYSSPATQTMIDTIQNILFTDFDKSTSFKISALRCNTDSLQAICTYIYVEDAEKIPDEIQLKNMNGQWLVDAQLIE